MNVQFFVGLHQPADARNFERACISINRLRGRKKPVGDCIVLVDSGAFTELLNNAIEHSGGTQVTVSMRQTPQQLQLLVSDDGRGIFDAIGETYQISDPAQAMLLLAQMRRWGQVGAQDDAALAAVTSAFQEITP